MYLTSLPDVCVRHPDSFTRGKFYQILGVLGNAYKVMNDRGDWAYVLITRFSEQ